MNKWIKEFGASRTRSGRKGCSHDPFAFTSRNAMSRYDESYEDRRAREHEERAALDSLQRPELIASHT
jgi:hypothetical protein